MLYLCLKMSGQSNAFYVYESDGSIQPYYSDYILPAQIDQVVWGNGNNIYLNRGVTAFVHADSAQIYRMGTIKLGAPYLGRTL